MVTDKGRLQVSPNPFMDHLTITVYSMIGLESSNLELIDMNGKVVYQQELSLKKGENVYNIVLPEAMPSGVYILKETQANGVVNIEKLIKQ